MNADILKQGNRFALYIDGRLIGSYTRKSSAVRRLNTLTAQAGGADARAADSAERAAVQPPPASNTGGQNTVQPNEAAIVSRAVSHFVMVNGRVKEIPLRRGHGTAAHIDTLTLTFTRSVFLNADYLDQSEEHDDLFLANIDTELREIFGFGLFKAGNGLHGYARSYVMGIDTVKYGFIAFGGKNQGDTVCLHLYGAGCTAARDGWETRLYQFIQARAPYARITRCDLAHDFLQGEYTVQQAYQDWQNGLYTNASTRPDAELAGKGWLNDPAKGKTLYIGSRKNGSRLLRVYEKGIEQGDPSSPWVRFELQLRNRDIVIGHDILIEPGCYLVGAYPTGGKIFNGRDTAKKCERVQESQNANLTHILKYASIQVAPAIKMLKHLGLDSDEVIAALERQSADFPKRLHPSAFNSEVAADVRFLQATRRSPLYTHELYRFLMAELEQKSASGHREATAAERERLHVRQYLDAVFGKHDYNYDIHGCDHDTYLHRRYGIFNPSS